MLVNVKFYKILTILILLSVNLSANEKDQIVTQLNNLKSLEFTFNQVVNEKTEKGSCLLEFPGKLKCDYFDDKKKELIINKKKISNYTKEVQQNLLLSHFKISIPKYFI